MRMDGTEQRKVMVPCRLASCTPSHGPTQPTPPARSSLPHCSSQFPIMACLSRSWREWHGPFLVKIIPDFAKTLPQGDWLKHRVALPAEKVSYNPRLTSDPDHRNSSMLLEDCDHSRILDSQPQLPPSNSFRVHQTQLYAPHELLQHPSQARLVRLSLAPETQPNLRPVKRSPVVCLIVESQSGALTDLPRARHAHPRRLRSAVHLHDARDDQTSSVAKRRERELRLGREMPIEIHAWPCGGSVCGRPYPPPSLCVAVSRREIYPSPQACAVFSRLAP